MKPIVRTDAAGVPRHVSFSRAETQEAFGPLAPQAQADEFLRKHGYLLALTEPSLDSLAKTVARRPDSSQSELRVETQKRVQDTHVVGYAQTYFGLPVVAAGVSVTLRDDPPSVLAASSTVVHSIDVARPSDTDLKRLDAKFEQREGQSVRVADLGLALATNGDDSKYDARINAARLVVFQFRTKEREAQPHEHPGTEQEGLQQEGLPTLPLPPLPATIRDGAFYVAEEVYFTMTTPQSGRLNWVMYVDASTLAILKLRALVDHATASVFLRDPITKGSGVLASATSAELNALRDPVSLHGLSAPVGGTQSLVGEFVTVVDSTLPSIAVPTTAMPYVFGYDARSDNFAAANTYFQCDRFFRMVRDLGFTIATYFDGTAFPVAADHRGFGGNTINARCPGNAVGNGIGTLEFALADLSDVANPIGIAADWRVVLHELGGHGILWDHVNSPNFGFAHSAGDSFAAILNDPGTAAPDRFVTFPWVNIGRRHDRTPAEGWGWGGANDVGGYSSEQILCTTLFRLYRSIGGDSHSVPRKEFAARTAAYLMLRAVGQLTPGTNPSNPDGFEAELETADAGVWTSINPTETHSGGAYWKVIRWAFEKQGLFKAPGAADTDEGAPPAVDVYIDDGRHGEYTFQPNHWSCLDIWNRRTAGDGGGVHEEPVVGATNYAYVRIKNRGTNAAVGIRVKGFHCQPGIGLTYPDDWAPMTTAELPAPDLAAGDAVGEIVGPFEWSPAQVGHECMFFCVSADDDESNLESRITGSIPEWRLVPHDNNIAQRNVHPIPLALHHIPAAKRTFMLRNPVDHKVRMKLKAELPEILRRHGWKLEFVSAGGNRFEMTAGARKEIVFKLAGGRPLHRRDLPQERAERMIVITAEAHGIPLGGMSYELDPNCKIGNGHGVVEGMATLVPADNGAGAPFDASALLRALNLDGSRIEGVAVRKLTVDILFKDPESNE